MLNLLIRLLRRLLYRDIFILLLLVLLLLSTILVIIIAIEQAALLGCLCLRHLNLLSVGLPALHWDLLHECLLAAHGRHHACPSIIKGHVELVCFVVVT
jgi:hypothetical protein